MRLKWLAIVAGLAAAAGAGATLVVMGGLYNVAATSQHTLPVYRLMELALERSVRVRAGVHEPPALGDAARLRGAACFRDLCVQCHGAPGVAPSGFAYSLQPSPGPLVDAGQRWHWRELYWITRHGIKMTGMPAWRHRLSDEDLWAVAAFTGELGKLSPQVFAQRMKASEAQDCSAPVPEAAQVLPRPMGDVKLGRETVQRYGCRSCHIIPGMTGPDIHVGPSLRGLYRREVIAGRLPNTFEHLAHWIRQPRELDPQTAMPDLGVSEQEARDMAAYLRTLP